MLVAQGGRFAGWSLYVVDGRPAYAYNYVGLELTHVRGERRLPPGGARPSRSGSPTTAAGSAAAGEVTLLLDGDEVGPGAIRAHDVPFYFSFDETLNVGVDRGTPVTDDYGTEDGFRFDGRVGSVTITAGEDALQPTDDQLLQAVLVTQ